MLVEKNEMLRCRKDKMVFRCRWCGVTDATYPYWKNRYCCDKKECIKKEKTQPVEVQKR